jgi:hypothetical protein
MLLTILIVLIVYGVTFAFLWGWSVIHAFITPHEALSRRGLWTLALIANPVTSMWYWYVWKRWAFWMLFIPMILFVGLLPFTLDQVILALVSRGWADRFVSIATLFLTDVVDATPLPALVPLLVFPYLLRLASLAHLGGNSELKAADRNDQAVAFSLPLVGFGAAMAYSFKWRRIWALFGLMWFVLLAGTTWWSFLRYVA